MGTRALRVIARREPAAGLGLARPEDFNSSALWHNSPFTTSSASARRASAPTGVSGSASRGSTISHAPPVERLPGRTSAASTSTWSGWYPAGASRGVGR